MCGIFGVLKGGESNLGARKLGTLLEALYKYSENRGKESAGLHCFSPGAGETYTLKAAMPASDFIKTGEYKQALSDFHSTSNDSEFVLAHSRLVTNGTAAKPQNNQPVHTNGVTAVHNGIVVNVDELWGEFDQLSRTAEVDTEIITAILASELESGKSAQAATQSVYKSIKGAASIAWVHDKASLLTLATNTGDLYYWLDEVGNNLVFASERYILSQALVDCELVSESEKDQVKWLPAGNLLTCDLSAAEAAVNSITDDFSGVAGLLSSPTESVVKRNEMVVESAGAVNSAVVSVSKFNDSLLRYSESSMRSLKRCSRCVLPHTFPHIKFDADGVCNYCHNYQPNYKGVEPQASKDEFFSSLEKYRRSGGTPDVLVPFSGGRDSCYGLHLIKKEFGFNPITFTYDWGMVTDLARRNTARMCGQLGVQNVLVSADIAMKRDNIHKNVSAWLKNPVLGLIPLFMAGDKHFFSIVNQVKRQTGIKLDLWAANPLENTDFKSGFCGVAPDFDKERLDYLSMGRKAKMAAFYGVNFLKNPRYINTSILDTLKAFSAYYFEPREDFFFMFDRMVWDEATVDDVLLNQYDFEKAPDTDSTWRIGDGTAPFYNYIYVTANGFSEFDTFRSNQIREGQISREDALEAVIKENRPRPESIKWYLDAINIDFELALKTVNKLDVMGLHQ